MTKTEFEKFKSDVKSQNISNFYIFHGKEDYMKNFYIKKIQDLLIDETFKSFNLDKFDENSFNVDEFCNCIESIPVMAERKVIIVRDLNLFKLNIDVKEKIVAILDDLPDYVCVIFDYATIEYKDDRRQKKIYKIITDKCNVVEFDYLSQKEMNKWLKNKFLAENLEISDKTCEYFTFICSMSMSNLNSECEKLIAYCKNEVFEKDIEDICSKVLEAKIFEITDKLINRDIISAKQLINDLILLKTDEFAILSVINSQFQRLYSAKLGVNKSEKYFMDLWGIYSSYAVKISCNQAKKIDIKFLLNACNLCVKASTNMVSINIDKSEILELLIVKIGVINVKS